MGWVVNATPRPLYPPGKDPVPTVYEAGWAQGPVSTRAEISPSTGVRFPYRPDRSESLYRLSYPGPSKQGISRDIWFEQILKCFYL
jgi:hypothetical protein